MKKTLLLLSMLCATLFAMAQVTTEPAVIPLGYKGKVVVTFNPAGTDMASQTTCYAHTGVITTEKGTWVCTTNWGTNTDKYKLTKSGSNWVLTIDDIYEYYACAKNMEITGLCFVFRNQAKTKQTEDFLIPFGFEEKEPVNQARPAGVTEGIFYDANDPTKVTVSLYAAPSKSGVTTKNVYIYCDANYWTPSNNYQCKKDGNYFWYTFTGLTPGKEYAFQYAIKKSNGAFVQMSDPYSTKLLHENDQWEPKDQDPTLMPYPKGAVGYVTVIQPGKKAFAWSNATTNFKRPDKNNLVIYELWVHAFSPKRSFKAVTERLDYLQNLGVNAIEFMPLCEFEGNLSWGYNPNHYFAIDKAYGSEADFKTLVDECHKRGIAVIVDMVLNHVTGNSPHVKLYGGPEKLSDNPYFNDKQHLPHSDDFFEDWSHVNYVKSYISKALVHWLKEYKVDGFRLDLSHGICTTTCSGRTGILEYYYNEVKKAASDAYFILEHWDFSGEREYLVSKGMMCWENTNEAYQEVALGAYSGGKSDLNAANKDGFVSYTLSHDEQRPFWKAKTYGVGTIKTNEATRVARVPAVMAMCAMLNGPQMIYQFEELGYDYSFCSNEAGTAGNTIDKAPFGQKQEQPCHDTEGKPIPESLGWYTNSNRMSAYQKVGQILQLRTKLAPSTFTGNPTSSDLGYGRALRSVIWGTGNSRIFVLANFGTASQSYTLPTGNNWYDYLAGSPSQLNGGKSMSIAAGDVKVFTATKYTLPQVPTKYDFSSAVGVEDLQDEPKASIYPTITSSFVTIDAEEEISDVQLMALSGQTYAPAYTAEGLVNLQDYDAGMYLLIVRFQTYERAFKVIVE